MIAAMSGNFAFSQAVNTGTIVGTITDTSGAVIPGAKITLTDVSTNSSRETVSNSTGQYVFQAVPPGTYDLIVVQKGFQKARVQGQSVAVGTQTTANVSMRVGQETQTIEVSADAVQLQTLNSTVGGAISTEAIQALPSLLHDAGTFTEMQPGVSPDGSVAGAVVDQSTFMLDGGNNSNDMDGSMTVYTPSFAGDPTGGTANQNGGVAAGPTGVMPTPADSIEEFKVNTAGQTADFNSSAGAQVEVVTKRGTDKFHGTVYEYYLDNNFSGNSWDNNLSGTKLPSYHYNKFGAGVGGPLLPRFLGGKTYFFALYQGWRFPQSATYEVAVPSANLRNGIATFNGVNYDLKAIDPRGIGISPLVQAFWNKYEPVGNATCGSLQGSRCDNVNEVGYKANMALPENDNFLVGRVDHDFGDKLHWNSSYRYYKLTRATNSQVDVGGFFTGDKLGTPVALANRPQQPWYFVTSLTATITPTLTNDFHFSYLRNFWQWSNKGAPPQVSGLGGAIEPMGESRTGVLAPFNVDTQDVRTRFWDGHDYFFRDDLSLLKGKHLLQFGGQFQRNWDYHQRTDNGGGINYTPTYQLGDGSGAGVIDMSSLGGGYPSSTTAGRVAAAAYGMVTDSQIAYTRSGSNLQLNPPLTPAFDKSTILFYNVYFSDTWHMKPSFTLTFGMGWTLEMPPTEATGKQDVVVDGSDTPIVTEDYLAQRKHAAETGQVYNPEIGWALVGNVGKGLKYPYKPFYGSFSPRVAVAWNPHFNADTMFGKVFGTEGTVIRGGYGHQYGRLNGVDLVLVPLLGVGLIQAEQCRQVLASGACGPNNPTASTAYRVGVDGTTPPLLPADPTLPQPAYPGYNLLAGSAAEAMDPNFRPNVIDSFDLTIQRQVNRTTLVEVGYIGRLIHHEYQPINLNAVPYMMTGGTQNFAAAYAGLETALGCATSAGACGASVPAAKLKGGAPNPAYDAYINGLAASAPQSFFDATLNSTYCNGTMSSGSGAKYANCTAAVLDNEMSNLLTQGVWSMWSDLDNGPFTFARTMENTPIPGQALGTSGQNTSGIAMNASVGYGNYNGGFISLKTNDWHGLTFQQNFTYSKALGTGAEVQATSEYTPNDAFDLHKMYGLQPFHRKFVYNGFVVANEPWFKNQAGLLGRLAGGWQVAPIVTAGSGEPVYCSTQTNAQSFGSADGNNYATNEQCVFTSKYKGGNSSHYGVSGGPDPYGTKIGTSVATSASGADVPINMFKDPVAVWNQVRAPMLGIDTRNPGVGPITGLPYWNMDVSLAKNFKITEQASFEYSMIFTNVLNHSVFADPGLSLGSPDAWGVLSSQINTPRKIEFGLRARF